MGVSDTGREVLYEVAGGETRLGPDAPLRSDVEVTVLPASKPTEIRGREPSLLIWRYSPCRHVEDEVFGLLIVLGVDAAEEGPSVLYKTNRRIRLALESLLGPHLDAGGCVRRLARSGVDGHDAAKSREIAYLRIAASSLSTWPHANLRRVLRECSDPRSVLPFSLRLKADRLEPGIVLVAVAASD
jgi:hypothetical protein